MNPGWALPITFLALGVYALITGWWRDRRAAESEFQSIEDHKARMRAISAPPWPRYYDDEGEPYRGWDPRD